MDSLNTLYSKGKEVFGDNKTFNAWLNEPNLYFDDKSPISFLNTQKGIDLVYNRLVGIAIGDNA